MIQSDMKRFLVAVAIAVVVLATLFLLPKRNVRGGGNIASFSTVMEDVRVVSRKEGKVLWSMRTSVANIPGDGSEAYLSNVSVDMSTEGITVTAPEGRYGLNDGSLSLDGGVRAETSQYVITASSVDVDAISGAITSTDTVVMEGGRFRVEGRGMKALGGKVWLNDAVKAEFF
jgi:hypothetical protein